MSRHARAGVGSVGRAPCTLALVLVSCVASPVASAQSYPTRAIRVVVPFAPGGGTDFIGRLIAVKLSDALRQQVVIDNRPGASGALGTEMAMRAPADGYTFVLVSAGYPVNAVLQPLKFDPIDDVSPVVQVARGPFLVVVHPSMPVKTLRGLIEFTRARPGEVNYASSGQGSILHMATELFLSMTQLKMTAIPYKGTGPALTETISGQTQVLFGSIAATLPHAKSGRLRALAVTSGHRVAAEPGIPTIAESGAPGYDVNNWHGLIGPRGIPGPIVERLNAEVNAALKLRDVQERLLSDGVSPSGGTAEAFRREIQREIEQWRKVAAQSGIRPEN